MTPSLITNRYIPLYTNNKIYVPFYENAPSSEILERLFVTYRLFNVSEEYFEDVFTATKYRLVPEDSLWAGISFHEKRGVMYAHGFKYADKRLDNEFRAEKVKELSEDYNKYLEINLDFMLNKYRINYLYYGPNERKITPDLDLNNRPFLEKVYNGGGVEIYKIKE
ncbi:MAG: hypothetical protein HQ536_03400, partial [Parcubacteria group bacterium]|nr:hypothetical protein [Parcubacteria group bacterium]